MGNTTIDSKQGHWMLAKMGKKVLRPGGKELTEKLIENLKINSSDDVVEFAPGLGFTASITLKSNPKTYTGIELNQEAANILRKAINGENRKIIVGNAEDSTLNENAYSKVYGEAMLTMQADKRKSAIIKEAHRILKKGGLYGIHELSLQPDNISEEKKAEIQRQLAQLMNVNARPLTKSEWSELLENEGFKVIRIDTADMRLLEPSRLIDDEGFFGAIKIFFNVLTHPAERKRILHIRQIFKKYRSHLSAICIIAEKK